jgi:hypothetical protein
MFEISARAACRRAGVAHYTEAFEKEDVDFADKKRFNGLRLKCFDFAGTEVRCEEYCWH